MMNLIEVMKGKYRYLVGPLTIGIITPSRKKHIINVREVQQLTGNLNPEGRLSPEDVATYIITNKLL